MPRRPNRKRDSSKDVAKAREQAREGETQNFNTQDFNTQVLEKNKAISTVQGPVPDLSALGDLAGSIRELVARFGAHAAPGQGSPSAAPASPGAMGGGATPPPPFAQSAAQRFLADRAQGENAPGAAGRGIQLPGARGAAGSVGSFLVKGLDDFGTKIGHAVAHSGLEVSAKQVAKENGDPGRFVESLLGTAHNAGIPGAGLLEGLAHKANEDGDARSGRKALQMARTRLADIAGGLAQRGATFSDSQLLGARNVLQERAQRELNVRLQIRNLEDGLGHQRSGLGSGGHAR